MNTTDQILALVGGEISETYCMADGDKMPGEDMQIEFWNVRCNLLGDVQALPRSNLAGSSSRNSLKPCSECLRVPWVPTL